jgi:nicotinate-nucleotide adenylyltransferase
VTAKRIGLLGGTFNPVHKGHLQLAEVAISECKLDQIVFIPSGQPPHKDGAIVASFADRITMLQIAGGNDERFSFTAIEGELPTPSYTIDTLQVVERMFPPATDLFFIIGTDAFLDLLSWKSYKQILQRITLIVSFRKGYDRKKLIDFLSKLKYVDSGGLWRGQGGNREIILLQKIPGNYSSTAIRAKIRKGIYSEEEIPKGVIEYIKKHALYQTSNAKAQCRA